MLALLDQTKEPFVASEAEAEIARDAAEKLQTVAAAGQDISVVVRELPGIIVPLPARVVHLMLQLLIAMKDRKPVSLIPHEAEMTTQQSADFLHVSRPFLISLLEKGEIPYRKVGRHRRVKFADIQKFEQASKAKRSAAIADMVSEAKRLGLDDDE